MNVNPQYTYDSAGNPIGVFLTIQEWQEIEKAIPEGDVSDREKDLIQRGLDEYHQNKGNLVAWETLKAEIEAEDGPL
jgi:hypothetical protein